MRIYMDEDTFNKIAANGHYSGMTADEYARTVLLDHLQQT